MEGTERTIISFGAGRYEIAVMEANLYYFLDLSANHGKGRHEFVKVSFDRFGTVARCEGEGHGTHYLLSRTSLGWRCTCPAAAKGNRCYHVITTTAAERLTHPAPAPAATTHRPAATKAGREEEARFARMLEIGAELEREGLYRPVNANRLRGPR